ncbi:MAG: Fic family protein [Kiritimatiellales bacterium]|nr:Fic family protein [Kiritimatiellales bacterium]
MKWNWQKEGWPEFRYDSAALAGLEAEFLTSSGVLLGACKHLDPEQFDALRVELVSEEALKTSAIEGEFLNRDSLQSSIRRQFGLEADGRRIPPAEEGIAELMVEVYRTWNDPLTDETLFNWHAMLTRGRRDLVDMGCYRATANTMQVVSGALDRRTIHFEAPPSHRVAQEMATFNGWFNRTAPGGLSALPSLTRAGIAHLYFVSIHPFEDGNGRIGRAIAVKSLSQSMGRSSLIALAHMIEATRKDYYAALERNNQLLEVTDWLEWFARTVLDAQAYTVECIEFLIKQAKLYARLGGQLNERQDKVLTRMFREGLGGFEGGLSADNYIRIAKTSASTATRDLQDLVAKGALVRTGELKATRYHLHL